MRLNRISAAFAETSYSQGTLTTSTLGRIGYSSAVATSLLDQNSLGFFALADICRLIRRSKSWIYEHGIVPLTDADGNPIGGGKKPPFPWLPLPPPCIDFGKKLWAKADIERWLLSIRARAISSSEVSSDHALSTSEVTA